MLYKYRIQKSFLSHIFATNINIYIYIDKLQKSKKCHCITILFQLLHSLDNGNNCIRKIPQSGICPTPCAYLWHVALLQMIFLKLHKFHPRPSLTTRYSWPPFYTPLYVDISHVIFICFMLSVICVHAATDSSPCAIGCIMKTKNHF